MKYFSLAALSTLLLFLPTGAMEHIASSDKELFSAIQKGDVAQVESALKKGANPNSLDYEERTPLIVAILARKIDSNRKRIIIRLLMASGADANMPDQLGVTPLRTAITLEDEVIVSQLIAGYGKKAKVNQPDTNGETPLMLATRIGNYNIARMLIQQHANKNFIDYEGNTALSIAEANDHEEIVELLTGQHTQPKTRRIEEHRYEIKEMCDILPGILKTNDPQKLKHGTNFNSINPLGLTLFGLAAADLKIANGALYALIETGADSNFVSPKTGRTPLMDFISLVRPNWSNSCFILQRIKFFIESGADVNHRDNQGNTLLMLSLENMPLDLIGELLDAGAHVNAANSLGITALSIVIDRLADHAAAHNERAIASDILLVELLISYGATLSKNERNILEPHWAGSLTHQMMTNNPEFATNLTEATASEHLNLLSFAIGIGNNAAARVILASEFALEGCDMTVLLALKRAVAVGNLEIIREICESQIIYIPQLTEVIEIAVLTGRLDILRYLLAQDPNHAVNLSYAITLARNQVRSSQQTTHQGMYDLLMAHTLPSRQGPQLLSAPSTSEQPLSILHLGASI